MSTVPQVSEAMQWVLNEFPRLVERKTGFVQRSTAQLDGVTMVRGLVLAWIAEPDASYAQLCSCIATLGVDVTCQALEQRFGPGSVKLFKEVLNEAVKQVICYEGAVPELFARFNGVYSQDGSIVTLPASMAKQYPGCGGKSPEASVSSMRLEVRWDLSYGGMSGPWINAGREAEHKGAAREEHLPEGSLFVSDGNYFTFVSMRERGQAGGLWLVPAKATLCFYDEQGVKTDLISYLKKHEQEAIVDVQIQAGMRDRLPCRLIAVRLNRAGRSYQGLVHGVPTSRSERNPNLWPKKEQKSREQEEEESKDMQKDEQG